MYPRPDERARYSIEARQVWKQAGADILDKGAMKAVTTGLELGLQNYLPPIAIKAERGSINSNY